MCPQRTPPTPREEQRQKLATWFGAGALFGALALSCYNAYQSPDWCDHPVPDEPEAVIIEVGRGVVGWE